MLLEIGGALLWRLFFAGTTEVRAGERIVIAGATVTPVPAAQQSIFASEPR